MTSLDELKMLSQDELIKLVMQYKEEYDDFRIMSNEMEKMLDSELETAKKEAKEKDRRLHLTDLEFSRLKERTENDRKEFAKIEENLRKELHKLKEDDKWKSERIRALEQKNDDLERTERYNQQEVEDLCAKLNQAMERVSLLENEVADKQAANEEMYRLREELKERPRLVVGPLRIERNDDTPDEPTPGKDRMDIIEDLSTGFTKSSNHNTETEELTGTKTFVSSVNRMIRDLLVKVESIEGLMSRQKKNSPRA